MDEFLTHQTMTTVYSIHLSCVYIACWHDATTYVIRRCKSTILPVESLETLINTNNL